MSDVLVIDDEAKNRALLRQYLVELGHDVREAASGTEGIVQAAQQMPDLVLSDVMMPPGPSGYEVARQIKGLAGDRFVPVVLVTALADQAARVEGLAAGADEFLSKPVDPQELGVRVTNLLALRAKEETLRRRALEHLALLKYRDEMSALIVHDLKGPLSVVVSNLEFALRDAAVAGETRDGLGDAMAAARRALTLVGNLLDVAALEAHRFVARRTRHPLGPILHDLVRLRASVARRRSVTVTLDVDDATCEVPIDRDLLTRALENVLDNAFRYVPAGGRVHLWTRRGDGVCEIRIGNDGPAVPAAARQAIFEKFVQGDAAAAAGGLNVGLGLYFCRLVAEAHGGRVWIEERPDLPAVFAFSLAA